MRSTILVAFVGLATCACSPAGTRSGDAGGAGASAGGGGGGDGDGGRDGAGADAAPPPDAGAPPAGCGTRDHPPAGAPAENKWRQPGPDGDSVVGLGHAIVWDTKGERLLLTGGFRGGIGTPPRFFTWDGGAADMKEIKADASIVGRAFHAMAYDEKEGAVVQFGGSRDWDGVKGEVGDTWIYSAGTWTEVPAKPAPSPRRGAKMVYDPVRGRVWLFGGGAASGSSPADTWQFDARERRWAEVKTAGAPPGRFMHALAYSSGDGRVYLFGGFDGKKSLADTWVFDPGSSAWCRIEPPASPPPRAETDLVYLPDRAVFMMYGGANRGGSGALLGDTWIFEPATNTWKDTKATIGGRHSAGHALTYFGKIGKAVLYGGYGGWEGESGIFMLHGILTYTY